VLLLPLTFCPYFFPLAFAKSKRNKNKCKKVASKDNSPLGKKIKRLKPLGHELFQWPIFLLLKKKDQTNESTTVSPKMCVIVV
jgi:hypothetical protein